MTFLEKYMELHPDADQWNVTQTKCPQIQLADCVPPLCRTPNLPCKDCWNREMTDEDMNNLYNQNITINITRSEIRWIIIALQEQQKELIEASMFKPSASASGSLSESIFRVGAESIGSLIEKIKNAEGELR